MSRRALRNGGVKESNETLNALARMINAGLLNDATVSLADPTGRAATSYYPAHSTRPRTFGLIPDQRLRPGHLLARLYGMDRTYWLDLFTVETWEEFLRSGGEVSGFSEKRWSTVRRMKPGDYLLCYLTRVSRWIGVLEVTGEPFHDETPIWASQVFPSRIPVRVITKLRPEHGVPVLDMRGELTVFQNLDNPNRWQGPFRGSPAKWKAIDGEAVVQALREAEASPVDRPLPLDRPPGPRRSPAAQEQADPAVSVPEDDEAVGGSEPEEAATAHTEIQYLLLKLGADMCFDVHVARNDQGRTWNGQRLGDATRRREHLPQQFDPVTNQTIELIDVLWLDGNAITAAFEIESTTSIYSGLLRMSDLLACQPNISVPLFLVAPGERREKVIQQVNRPTFDRMKPPLAEVCRYISFEGLRDALVAAREYVSFLKPDWLQKISESCDAEDL